MIELLGKITAITLVLYEASVPTEPDASVMFFAAAIYLLARGGAILTSNVPPPPDEPTGFDKELEQVPEVVDTAMKNNLPDEGTTPQNWRNFESEIDYKIGLGRR